MNFETWYNIDDDCRYWYASGEESAEELYQAILDKYKLEHTTYDVVELEPLTRVRVKINNT